MQIIKPIVSVIIPVFNSEKTLKRCISSILQQTFTSLDIICVDDGSTDSSKEILEYYRNFDSRIRVISIEHQGLSAARNMGLQEIHGQYVAFCDSDDYVSERWIEELLKTIELYESDVAICGFKRVSYDEEYVGERFITCQEGLCGSIDLWSVFKNHLLTPAWNKLYSSEVIRQNRILFDESMINCEDLAFNISYMMNAVNGYAVVSETLYFYRNSPKSLSKQYALNLWPSKVKQMNALATCMNQYSVSFAGDQIGWDEYRLDVIERCLQNCLIDINFRNVYKRYKESHEIMHSDIMKQILDSPASYKKNKFLYFAMRQQSTLLFWGIKTLVRLKN